MSRPLRMASVTSLATRDEVSAIALCAAMQYSQPFSKLTVRKTTSCSAGVKPDSFLNRSYPSR